MKKPLRTGSLKGHEQDDIGFEMAVTKRTVEFKPKTRNLFLHVNTRCNLRCVHCYINPEQHGRRGLNEKTIKEWLSIFLNGDINLVLLGGEPTLNPALPFAVKEAKRLGYASVTVDTNGYLFNDFLEKVRPDELDYISFSLDGPSPEINDPVRGKGSFETCVKGIKRALKKGFEASVIFTASRLNIHGLAMMPELLISLGVRRFFIQVIGIRGRTGKGRGDELQLSRDEWERFVPEVAMNAAEKGIHVTYPKVFLTLDEPFQCAALVSDNFFVFPNGRVYRCPICEDYPVHSMEIRDGVLKKRPPITEAEIFQLNIPEGCVFNRILQPGNIPYDEQGKPLSRIACCMLKEELLPE